MRLEDLRAVNFFAKGEKNRFKGFLFYLAGFLLALAFTLYYK